MTLIPPESSDPDDPKNQVRAVSVRKLLMIVALLMLMVIAWGMANTRLNRQILEELKELHQKVDSLAPTKSE